MNEAQSRRRFAYMTSVASLLVLGLFTFASGTMTTDSNSVYAAPPSHWDHTQYCGDCEMKYSVDAPESHHITAIKWSWGSMVPCVLPLHNTPRVSTVSVELLGDDGTQMDNIKVAYDRASNLIAAPNYYSFSGNRLRTTECSGQWPSSSSCGSSNHSYPVINTLYELALDSAANRWVLKIGGKTVKNFTSGMATQGRLPTHLTVNARSRWENDLGVLRLRDVEIYWQPTGVQAGGWYSWPSGPQGTSAYGESWGSDPRYIMDSSSGQIVIYSDHHRDHYTDRCGGTP